ncbi:hypothetical protein LCGC14_2098350, partial [marine sediment metagenome]
ITAKRQLHMALAGENKVRVDFGQTAAVVINLVQGTPPEWLKLIPTGEPTLQSQVFAPQLEAAVRRVGSIAKDGKGVCRGCAENMTATMPHRQEYPLETYKLDVRKALALFAAARGEMHMPLKRLGHGSG